MLIFRSSFQFPIKRFASLASQLQISVMNGDLLATVTVGVFRSGSRMFSACLHTVGFLWGFWFPPTFQKPVGEWFGHSKWSPRCE